MDVLGNSNSTTDTIIDEAVNNTEDTSAAVDDEDEYVMKDAGESCDVSDQCPPNYYCSVNFNFEDGLIRTCELQVELGERCTRDEMCLSQHCKWSWSHFNKRCEA